MNPFNYMAGPLGFVFGIVIIIWSFLMLFAPFFWYGSWYRSKQLHLETMEIKLILTALAKARGVEFVDVE